MNKKGFNRNAIVLIFIAIFLAWLISFMDRDRTYVAEPSSIPVPPDNSGTWHYDYQKGTWVNIYSSTPRANGENSLPEPKIDEDDLQKYLEEHVDGYLEDTYWGEEFDLKDPDNK